VKGKHIFVDYNRIGYAKRFRTPVFKDERDGLAPGVAVTVIGDDVDPQEGRVLSVSEDGREAEIEIVHR
jgi:hypothetical protein